MCLSELYGSERVGMDLRIDILRHDDASRKLAVLSGSWLSCDTASLDRDHTKLRLATERLARDRAMRQLAESA